MAERRPECNNRARKDGHLLSSHDPVDVICIDCPYCGESVELSLELDVEGEMILDCEVCCRPWLLITGRDGPGARWWRVERTD